MKNGFPCKATPGIACKEEVSGMPFLICHSLNPSAAAAAAAAAAAVTCHFKKEKGCLVFLSQRHLALPFGSAQFSCHLKCRSFCLQYACTWDLQVNLFVSLDYNGDRQCDGGRVRYALPPVFALPFVSG